MTPGLEEFKAACADDGYDLQDPAEAVVLAAFVIGPNVREIAKFLGRPLRELQGPARLLRANDCWRGSKIVLESEGPEIDGVEVVTQILVAKGMVEKTPA